MIKDKRLMDNIWMKVLINGIIVFILSNFLFGFVGGLIEEEFGTEHLKNLITYLLLALVWAFTLKNKLKKDFNSIDKVALVCVLLLSVVSVELVNLLLEWIFISFDLEFDSMNQQVIVGRVESASMFSILVIFINTVILVPIIEEIVCRGLLVEVVWKLGKIPAVLISSLTFGFMHVVAFGDYISLILYLYPAILLSSVYVYSNKNILIVIVIHILLNFLAFVQII